MTRSSLGDSLPNSQPMTCWSAQMCKEPSLSPGMWPRGRDMTCPGCPLNRIQHWCMWVTLSQAVSVLCPGWISSSSQAAQETQIYLNPGFSCAASQQGHGSSLSGTETAVCSSLLGYRWGKHRLVGSAVPGCRRWRGMSSRRWENLAVWLPSLLNSLPLRLWSAALRMDFACWIHFPWNSRCSP